MTGTPERAVDLQLSADDPLNLTLTKMLATFAHCPWEPSIEVLKMDTTKTGDGMSRASFISYGAKFSKDVRDKKDNKLKKVNPALLWLNDPRRINLRGQRMRPDKPQPFFEDEEDGEVYGNTYRRKVHPSIGGSPQGGIALLEQVFPDRIERQWYLQWLAYKWRHPEVPGPAVMMVARQYGTGRDTLGELVGHIFGSRYVTNIAFDHFTGRTTSFTEWQAEYLIVLVSESSTADSGSAWRAKHDIYERLKEIVDPRSREKLIQGKYVKAYRAPVHASYMISTNNPDALPLPPGDRRFAVLENGDPQPQEFWDRINEWMSDPANVGAFVRWLEAVDLSDYSPYAPPLKTVAKRDMSELAHSDLDRAFDDALQNLPGKLLVPEQIIEAMQAARRHNSYDFPTDRVEPIIKKIIRTRMHRVGIQHGANWFYKAGRARYPIYARSKADAKEWTQAEQQKVHTEILRSGQPSSPQSINTAMSKVRLVATNSQEM